MKKLNLQLSTSFFTFKSNFEQRMLYRVGWAKTIFKKNRYGAGKLRIGETKEYRKALRNLLISSDRANVKIYENRQKSITLRHFLCLLCFIRSKCYISIFEALKSLRIMVK